MNKMKLSWIHCLLLAYCVSLPLVLCSCAPVIATGAMTAGHILDEEVEFELDGSIHSLHPAILSSLEAYGARIIKEELEPLNLKVLAKDSEDRITVSVTRIATNRVRCSILVGYLGDRAKARDIKNLIRDHILLPD